MEDENNTPEGQQQNSSNTFPGASPERAQQAYNAGKSVKNLNKNAKNVANKAKNAAKKTKKVVEDTVQAARAAYAAAQAALAAAQAAFAGAAAALGLTTWELILVIIVIIIILAVAVAILKKIGVLGLSTSSLQLNQSGPIRASLGDKIDYLITVSYPGTAKEIIITDQIPDGTQYINAPQANFDPLTNTVTWKISTDSGSLVSNINQTLPLTLSVTKNNNYVTNIPKGKVIGEVTGGNDSIDPNQIIPTLFQEIPTKIPGENDSPNSNTMVTPTIYQKTSTDTPPPPYDTNIVSNCVVTKIGDPEVIPSLPPECTSF